MDKVDTFKEDIIKVDIIKDNIIKVDIIIIKEDMELEVVVGST